MFKNVLPAFRALGLTEVEERTIMTDNPRRIMWFWQGMIRGKP